MSEPTWEQPFNRLSDRVTRIERDIAVREETLKGVESRLAKIETILSRLTWLMVVAIGSAAMGFILSGGLHVIH